MRDGTSEPWDKFLTTVSGVAGLVPLCARAYGPGDTALADTLRKVNTATTPVAQQAFAKAVKEPAKPKVGGQAGSGSVSRREASGWGEDVHE